MNIGRSPQKSAFTGVELIVITVIMVPLIGSAVRRVVGLTAWISGDPNSGQNRACNSGFLS